MSRSQPFDDVVATHGPTILRVCRALLGPGPDADDVWSETFLAALRAWPDLPNDAIVEAWLVTIAHRKVIDHHRATGRRPTPVADPPGSSAVAAAEPTHPVWAAVAKLPDKQRWCVTYRYLGGLAHADIANLVGGSSAAARRACADGIAALRRTVPDLQELS